MKEIDYTLLIARRIEQLHSRIAWLASLCLKMEGCDRIALELADIRRELSDLFELVRPKP